MQTGAGATRRLRFTACAALALAAVIVATASAATGAPSGAPPSASIPPPPPPYQLGDQVWYGEAPPVVLSPLGNGCQRVPTTGYLASGATDRTTGEYSNYWSWSAGSAVEPFNWWVYSTGGTLYASGSSAADASVRSGQARGGDFFVGTAGDFSMATDSVGVLRVHVRNQHLVRPPKRYGQWLRRVLATVCPMDLRQHVVPVLFVEHLTRGVNK